MMNRELDIECAKAMEWERLRADGDLWRERGNPILWWTGPSDRKPRTPHRRWSPSTDCKAAQMLEAEIERRGLWYVYACALLDFTNKTTKLRWWDISSSFTPEQKAGAFLKAIRG